jgi:hypothetical protein
MIGARPEWKRPGGAHPPGPVIAVLKRSALASVSCDDRRFAPVELPVECSRVKARICYVCRFDGGSAVAKIHVVVFDEGRPIGKEAVCNSGADESAHPRLIAAATNVLPKGKENPGV